MPAREFWRLWARASVVIVLAALFLLTHMQAHAAVMRASFYGAESGRLNANGSRFSPMGFSAANWSMAFGTRLRVCFRGCAIVTVLDRGPARWTGRTLDLSQGAARAIGLEAVGVANIDVTVVGQGGPGGVANRIRRHVVRHPVALRRVPRHFVRLRRRA